MDKNRNLEPYLVEIDNLGAGNNDPAEYSLLWWLKKILEASGGTAGTPLDVRSSGWENITSETVYKTIVEYKPTIVTTFNLGAVMISYVGMTAEFVVEHSEDGTSPQMIRGYILNTQQPTFTENVNQNIKLLLDGTNGYVKIKVKSNYKNQDGKAFGVLNGYI